MFVDLQKTFPRKYLSASFDPENKEQTEEYYKNLLLRNISDKDSLLEFLEIRSEFHSCLEEKISMAYVNMTIDTKNNEAEKQYFYLVENIVPLMEEYGQKLKEKILSSTFLKDLDANYYEVFAKAAKTDIDIFRTENIPLSTEDSKLSQQYQKISGGWMVDFEGKTYTTQQMALFLEDADRDLRERAYRARVLSI